MTIKRERQERNLDALRPFKHSRVEDDSDDDLEAIAARPAKRRATDPGSEIVELSE